MPNGSQPVEIESSLSRGCQGKERTLYELRKNPLKAIPEIAILRLACTIAGNLVFFLGEIKLPLSISRRHDELVSWLGKNERGVLHICTDFRDSLRNEIDCSSEELESCFSRFIKVRMCAFVSACFHK